MSHRSKREAVKWHCPECGCAVYFFPGEHRICPYLLHHRRLRKTASDIASAYPVSVDEAVARMATAIPTPSERNE